MNELKILVSLLEGYTDKERYEILAAMYDQSEGTWTLEVRKAKLATEAENDNN